MEGRSPEIFAPSYTRPYTYGLDIITGYMTLMSRLQCSGIAGEAFNFGPPEPHGVSNGQLATKLCELWGSGVTWHSGNPRDEPFQCQSISCEKSRQLLGWQPAFTLHEALAATTRWYQTWARTDCRGEGRMFEFNRGLLREHRAAAERLGIRWASQN
jgi:CDP-glucose 4,6-dehydratase